MSPIPRSNKLARNARILKCFFTQGRCAQQTKGRQFFTSVRLAATHTAQTRNPSAGSRGGTRLASEYFDLFVPHGSSISFLRFPRAALMTVWQGVQGYILAQSNPLSICGTSGCLAASFRRFNR